MIKLEFTPEMVKAIREGRKTRTSRIIKPYVYEMIENYHFVYGIEGMPALRVLDFCPFGNEGSALEVVEKDSSGFSQSTDLIIRNKRSFVDVIQNITEEQAKAEGVVNDFGGTYEIKNYRWHFRKVWEEIYGPEAWTSNPQAFIMEFEVIKCK